MPATFFNSRPIYVLDAVRTAVGSPFKSLKNFSAAQLAGFTAAALIERSSIKSGLVDEVVLGNTVQAGVGQNPARQAAILGGCPTGTTAYTVNNVCAAGLQAVVLAGQSIVSGSARCVIAGGTESATRTPQLFSKLVETPFNDRDPVDSLIYDGLWCTISGQHMGQLAERLKISRGRQDEYALESHQKAASGQFQDEIVKVVLDGGASYDHDERIRRRVTLENFAVLPPAFAESGTVTSGNASVPSDGAAALLLGSEGFAEENKCQPLARILGYASIALNPELTFTAAVPAVEACLKACRLRLRDIDLFEICEAFAAQAIYTREALNIPADKMNIYGGDIALGHSLGAAGARIVVTLAHALRTKNKKYGMAAICYGGGGAMALIIGREDKS